MKTKTKKKKATTKAKALVPAKRQAQFARYEPPPPPPRYEYPPSPGLDPQTRHLLVNLESQVKQFQNVESRVADLAIQVRQAENQAANVPESWWHQLQVSISTLQKEFRDRVPPLERQYANMEFVLHRMTRVEDRVEALAAELELERQLRKELQELLDRIQKPKSA